MYVKIPNRWGKIEKKAITDLSKTQLDKQLINCEIQLDKKKTEFNLLRKCNTELTRIKSNDSSQQVGENIKMMMKLEKLITFLSKLKKVLLDEFDNRNSFSINLSETYIVSRFLQVAGEEEFETVN